MNKKIKLYNRGYNTRTAPDNMTKRQVYREIGNLLFLKHRRGFFGKEQDLLFGYRGRNFGIALANPFKVKPFAPTKTIADDRTWVSPLCFFACKRKSK